MIVASSAKYVRVVVDSLSFLALYRRLRSGYMSNGGSSVWVHTLEAKHRRFQLKSQRGVPGTFPLSAHNPQRVRVLVRSIGTNHAGQPIGGPRKIILSVTGVICRCTQKLLKI